jgi:hypothetical protein
VADKRRPVPPSPDDQPARRRPDENTVDVTVGADKDAQAIAETQNRQVGVDDTKENREKLHEAVIDQGKTVEIDVPHDNRAGQTVPERLADDKDALSPSTRSAMPGYSADDPDDEVRSVTINGQNYTWRKGEEKSVPQEAVEVYERSREANTP